MVKAKYLNNNTDNSFSVKKNPSASTAWKNILDHIYLIKRGTK